MNNDESLNQNWLSKWMTEWCSGERVIFIFVTWPMMFEIVPPDLDFLRKICQKSGQGYVRWRMALATKSSLLEAAMSHHTAYKYKHMYTKNHTKIIKNILCMDGSYEGFICICLKLESKCCWVNCGSKPTKHSKFGAGQSSTTHG